MSFGKTRKNEEKEAKNRKDERNGKCVPPADRIFERIVRLNPATVLDTKEQYEEAYEGAVKESLQDMLDSGLTVGEVNYVLQLARLKFDNVTERIARSVEMSGNKALKITFGGEFNDVTLQKLDEILTVDAVEGETADRGENSSENEEPER